MLGFNLLNTIISFSDKGPGELSNHWLDGPAIENPEGIEPQFDNPPNENRVAIGVAITRVLLASAFVLICIFSRILYKRVNLADGRNSDD